MGLTVWFINTLIMRLYKKDAAKFYRNLGCVEQVQRALLLQIIKKNQDTDFGRNHGFAEIKTIEDFRKHIPILEYPDYKEDIERIATGHKKVLTAEEVLMFELTGGSGGATKLIPYTASLKQEFLWGIKPWIYSLYKNYPKLRGGKSYWSITPPTHQDKYTSGGIPIGFEDDTAYFGRFEQKLTDKIFVRDKSIRKELDMEKFYFQTCLALLSERNLRLISVWNPSYLFVLLNYMETHAQSLYSALSPKRLRRIQGCIEAKKYREIWPNLTLISCWCDGLARHTSEEIRALFPGVVIQPKGILSTEAFMTLPYEETGLSLLSYYSHYFEFLHTKTGRIYSYTELEKGMTYEVIFTTSGGFYRYRIHDAVQVVEYEKSHGLPLLKFVGKADKTVDFHGEKLNELFVNEIMDELSSIPNYEENLHLSQRFCLLAYENGGYVLYLGSEVPNVNSSSMDTDILINLEHTLDKLLCESYHYKLCRDLKQLNPAKVYLVYGDAKQQYINYYLEKGKKLGDIKPELLSKHSDWSSAFQMEEI